MPVETELKLALPPAVHGRITATLARLDLSTTPASDCRLDNIYYDTSDLQLWQQRIALRRRRIGRRWLLTVKTDSASDQGGLSQRQEWEYAAASSGFDFRAVDSATIRQFLAERTPALIPLFRTDFRRRTWLITPRDGSTIELALDSGWIQSGDSRSRISEIELELKQGRIGDLLLLAQRLGSELPLTPDPRSKAKRGLALFQNLPEKPATAALPPLDGATPIAAATRQLLLGQLDAILANAHNLSPHAPEYLHQMRVAVRRLRSTLRATAPHLPKGFAKTWAKAWGAIARDLGQVRDHDVMHAWLPKELGASFPGHAGQLAALLTESQLAAHATLRRHLARQPPGRLAIAFLCDLHAPEFDACASHGPAFIKGLRRRLVKPLRTLTDGLCCAHTCSESALHALRIDIKRCRYSLDLLVAAHDPDATRLARKLGPLQDTFGRFNDLSVAAAWLAGQDNLPEQRLIQGWLTARRQQARNELLLAIERFLKKHAKALSRLRPS